MHKCITLYTQLLLATRIGSGAGDSNADPETVKMSVSVGLIERPGVDPGVVKMSTPVGYTGQADADPEISKRGFSWASSAFHRPPATQANQSGSSRGPGAVKMSAPFWAPTTEGLGPEALKMWASSGSVLTQIAPKSTALPQSNNNNNTFTLSSSTTTSFFISTFRTTSHNN